MKNSRRREWGWIILSVMFFTISTSAAIAQTAKTSAPTKTTTSTPSAGAVAGGPTVPYITGSQIKATVVPTPSAAPGWRAVATSSLGGDTIPSYHRFKTSKASFFQMREEFFDGFESENISPIPLQSSSVRSLDSLPNNPDLLADVLGSIKSVVGGSAVLDSSGKVIPIGVAPSFGL